MTFTHDGQSFDIVYFEESHWSKEIKQLLSDTASLVKETIIHSWDKFKPLMKTKPSMPFIIELLDMPNGLFGEEFFKDGNYRIRLNYNYVNNKVLIRSTTAHELFHTFQDELHLGYSEIDEKWLSEATAVWSEHYAYAISCICFSGGRLPLVKK